MSFFSRARAGCPSHSKTMVSQEILARCFLSANCDSCWWLCFEALNSLCKNFLFEVIDHLQPRLFVFHLCEPWLLGITTKPTKPIHSPSKLDLSHRNTFLQIKPTKKKRKYQLDKGLNVGWFYSPSKLDLFDLNTFLQIMQTKNGNVNWQ